VRSSGQPAGQVEGKAVLETTTSDRGRPTSTPRRLTKSGMPKIAGLGLFAAAHLRTRAWDKALANVEKAQRAQLEALLRHARDTEFGRAHGFADIQSHEDFVRRVPIGDYDAFSPAIDRMRRGEKNVLVPEFVEHFGCSSGSSNRGKLKYLPITERQLKYQRGNGGDALCRYLVRHDVRDFTDGFVLNLVPPITMKREGPVNVTSNPALMALRLPAATRAVYLPDRPTMCIADYDAKLERIADRYLDHDVRMVTGTTCWFSLLFDKLLDAARRRGRNVETVSELWPNLRVFLGGGVAAGPYVPVIRERMGRDDVELIDTYNATEGGVYASTSFEPGLEGMLVIPHRGVFFEFVPLEEHGKPEARRVPLWGVVPNQMYVIVVTTSSGLYAYELGDIVRFTSVSPHCMEFAGRLSGCLSTTQELTTHVEIQKAFEEALRTAPATVVDYGAAADVGVDGSAKSRYVVFAELTGKSDPFDPDKFIRAFDAALCEQNRVYREHRAKDTAILEPELVLLPSGSVQKFMQHAGNGSVQTKFPRILDDERKELLRSYVTTGRA
jgi:hypothetical protein